MSRCVAHRAEAGWMCTVCEEALCPDCAATRVIPPVSMTVCALCGELAEPLLRPKSEAVSFGRRAKGSLTFPFHGDGLAVWLGIALWLWLTSLLGALSTALGWAATVATLFGITRSTARTGDDIELSDMSDWVSGVVLPTVRLAVVLCPLWGGAWLASSTGHAAWRWAAVLVACVWCPTAYIGAATGARLVDLLNPWRVLGVASQLGKDLAAYVVSILAVLLMMVLSLPLASAVQSLWAPVVAGVAAHMVLAYAPLVGARIAGFILLLHGPLFGWGDERSTQEPVLGDTPPRGQWVASSKRG